MARFLVCLQVVRPSRLMRAVRWQNNFVFKRLNIQSMNTIDDILAAVQALPSSERVRLVGLLWDKLGIEDWRPPNPEWIEEANRRSDAVDSGSMPVDNWNNVRSRARRQAGLDG